MPCVSETRHHDSKKLHNPLQLILPSWAVAHGVLEELAKHSVSAHTEDGFPQKTK